MRDPWFKATLPLEVFGKKLKLEIPHDVFSTLRIDEGTVLLLEHLPQNEPASVLDLGCGYGALGLPIAARYPQARFELVDRDLLAVRAARGNAALNALSNIDAHGSLGFRDIDPERRYDWILCNVPARIGRPFIEHLFASGRARLTPTGELRVVVINDLAPLLEELKSEHSWPLEQIARGPRHSIFALPASGGIPPAEPCDLYLRDSVELQGLRLERPFDLGGDDPKRLSAGLPTLLDLMPKQLRGSVLCFRAGYGQLALSSLKRWPEAKVVAIDRDLLGTTYVRRNADSLGLAGERLEIRESAHFPDALSADERFDLILGELSPSAGERVAEAELRAVASALVKGGQALILSLEKLEREWLSRIASRLKLAMYPALRRDGYVVFSIRGA